MNDRTRIETAGAMLVLALASSAGSPAAAAGTPQIEEVRVVGELDTRVIELDAPADVAPDSTALLRKAVGANVVSNGPLTGMAQYRGMSRFRISSNIDGAVISPGGPNWMDPPLSYAPAANLDHLEVYRGIAPVSAGQETIGGVVNASTWSGGFAEPGGTLSGRARAGVQTVNQGTMLSAAVALADDAHRLKLAGLTEQADDAEFPGGEIRPSEYRRDRYDVGYSVRRGSHTLRFDYARSETGDAGTAALAMDIEYIDTDLFRVAWDFEGDDLSVNARVYHSDIGHGMTSFHLRPPPAAGMYRRNTAGTENRGFSAEVALHGWLVGVDGHEAVHDSRIGNPNDPMFFVDNFDEARRRILGVFAEREITLESGVRIELGGRYNQVKMDADPVDATPAAMGTPAAVALRDAFNDADRSRRDHNLDWVAKVYLPAGRSTVLYGGMARKTRSPAYQERYLWLPLQATAGLADGRTYTGNPGLEPEVSHEVELGIDFQRGDVFASPRIFYRRVDDYIQGIPSTRMPAVMFVETMDAGNGTRQPRPLEFANVDAVFYGADLEWRYRLGPRWTLDGTVNLVRGKRDDVDDDLYRVAPPNAYTGLSYRTKRLGVTLETFLYADQNRVSHVNSELESDGYGLVNLKGSWALTPTVRLGFGVDNVFDARYEDHLAGVNRVQGNPDIAVGERLPGFGRSFFARLDLAW